MTRWPKQPLADCQRADHILGDDPARVAKDVRLALVDPEHPVHVEPRIYAGDDRDMLARGQRRRTLKRACVRGVVERDIRR